MEGAPTDLDTEKLHEDLENSSKDPDNILNIHEFHVWSISVGKHAMSCHIETKTPNETLIAVTNICKKKYKIDNLAIQIEDIS